MWPTLAPVSAAGAMEGGTRGGAKGPRVAVAGPVQTPVTLQLRQVADAVPCRLAQ